MPNITKKLGIGAKVDVFAKYLYPSAKIRDKYGENGLDKLKVKNSVVIAQAPKTINRRDNVASIVCRHDDFPNEELCWAMTLCKLKRPGDEVHYFVNPTRVPAAVVVNNPVSNNVDQEEIVVELCPTNLPVNSQISIDDVRRIQAEGFTVDDDNLPIEDNIPAINDGQVQWADWGFLGIDLRHENNQQFNHGPKLPHSEVKKEFNLFWTLFPKKYVKEVLLPATNNHLTKG